MPSAHRLEDQPADKTASFSRRQSYSLKHDCLKRRLPGETAIHALEADLFAGFLKLLVAIAI